MSLEPGTLVAKRYRVDRPLGKGGMGEVFSAENIRTGRQVAIKLLRAESKAKASAVERFRREAKAAGAIVSDHVTQVLDVEDDPEHGIVLVFELLQGESLVERLKRTGPIGYVELWPIVEAVWIGLADAHAAGIVHRDLKPSNVFLETRPGSSVRRVKILDFGISKLPKKISNDSLTQVGQSLGTFSFMPPEQIGKAKSVDHRADIYAATTLIYQALSGQLPYQAKNVVTMMELKGRTEPRSLAEAMGGAPVDPRLEALITKGLARDPNARFQTALEALEAWRKLRPAGSVSLADADSAFSEPPSAPSGGPRFDGGGTLPGPGPSSSSASTAPLSTTPGSAQGLQIQIHPLMTGASSSSGPDSGAGPGPASQPTTVMVRSDLGSPPHAYAVAPRAAGSPGTPLIPRVPSVIPIIDHPSSVAEEQQVTLPRMRRPQPAGAGAGQQPSAPATGSGGYPAAGPAGYPNAQSAGSGAYPPSASQAAGHGAYPPAAAQAGSGAYPAAGAQPSGPGSYGGAGRASDGQPSYGSAPAGSFPSHAAMSGPAGYGGPRPAYPSSSGQPGAPTGAAVERRPGRRLWLFIALGALGLMVVGFVAVALIMRLLAQG